MKKRLIFVSILAVSLFLSCDMDVAEYFEKYTETAAIGEMEIEGSFPKGSNDATCFPSDDDHTITFYLRNPQNFQLEPRYTFNNPSVSADSSDLEFVQDASDRTVVHLTFKQPFLRQREELLTLTQKDISGVVSFYEPLSGRIFDSYPVKVHANTTPPAILNPCFQLTSSGADGQYIVCFYMPKLEEGTIHKDSYDFIVNSEHLYINGASSSDRNIYQTRDNSADPPAYTNQDSRFTTSVPSSIASTMTSLEEGGFQFNAAACPDGYIPMYFMTGLAPTTDITTFNFTIRDDDGLSNSIAISNQAKQLESPAFNVTGGQAYAADEETLLYTLQISHSGLCTDGSSCGPVRISYTITERNHSNVFAGGTRDTMTATGGNSVLLRLPRGDYNITANAFKDYYIASESSSVTNFKVRSPAIFYVAQNGEDNDSRSGSRNEPFRTVNFAFDTYTTGVTNSIYDSDSICDIRIATDITPPADFDYTNAANHAFVNVPSTFTGPLKITGYGGMRTIDADSVQGTRECRVMYLGGGSVTLENLEIRGGITTPDADRTVGAGIKIVNTVSSIMINNCTVTANTGYKTSPGDLKGGGISSTVNLNMTNCTVSYNTLSSTENANVPMDGSGIWMDESKTLTAQNCTINNNTGGSALYSVKTEMTGGAVQNNKVSANVYFQSGAGIWGSGNFTNVEISGNYFESETANSYGGGIEVYDTQATVFKNCNIHDNKAMTAGGLQFYPGADVTLENCTIKDNISYGNADDPDNPYYKIGGISNYKEASSGDVFYLTLKGKNYIYGNKKKDGSAAINLYIRKNSEDEKIEIDGNISQSTIGIYYDFDSDLPTAGHDKVFTHGYDYPATNSKKPSEVFIAENNYGILAVTSVTDYGEAAFGVSTGYTISVHDYTFEPALKAGQNSSMYFGAAKTFTLDNKIAKRRVEGATPTYIDLYYNPADKKLYQAYNATTHAYSQPDPSGEVVELSAALYSSGRKLAEFDLDDLDVTIAANAPYATGNHQLRIIANFLSTDIEKNIPIAINRFADTVADYISSLTAAGTYNVIVEGSVGTELSGGLLGVANAIKDHGTTYIPSDGVLINLDASRTINSEATDNYTSSYFGDCKALASIKLPNWMYGVIPNLFAGCSSLSSVTLGTNIDSIYANAFKNCTSLTCISLPQSLEEIEEGAFFGCNDGNPININYAGTKDDWGKVRRPDQDTNPWHSGAKDERENAGTVTCTDGSCGLDYFVSMPLASVASTPSSSGILKFTISTAAELDRLADWSTNDDFEGLTFILQNDITASDNLAIKQFAGTFDGNGHCITQKMKTINNASNIDYVELNGEASNKVYHYQKALFWTISYGAVIKNLKTKGTSNRAGFVGVMNGGLIENCINETVINATILSNRDSYLCGFAAVMNGGTIRNCINKGSVNNNYVGSNTDRALAAGIAGSVNHGIIENCINYADIGTESSGKVANTGGITCAAYNVDSIIRNSKNKGNLYSRDDSPQTAGLIPVMQNSAMFNCSNSGNTSNNNESSLRYKTSGLIQKSVGPNFSTMKNCCNTGNANVGCLYDLYCDYNGQYKPSTYVHNYSITGDSPLPTSVGASYFSNVSQSWSAFTDSEFKGFAASDASTILSELNQWATQNSNTNVTYKQWKLVNGLPELNLDDVEAAVNAIFGD